MSPSILIVWMKGAISQCWGTELGGQGQRDGTQGHGCPPWELGQLLPSTHGHLLPPPSVSSVIASDYIRLLDKEEGECN